MCGLVWRIAVKAHRWPAKLAGLFRLKEARERAGAAKVFQPGQLENFDAAKDRAGIRRALSNRLSPHLLKDVGGDEG